MDTNAADPVVADLLSSAIADGCRFVSLTTRKKGVKGNGQDLVWVRLACGFSYTNLCDRSVVLLSAIDPTEAATEGGFDPAVTAQAHTELLESLQKSATGTNSSTTDHVFEPLRVNGEVVPGARVYTGTDAARPGTVYLQGLKVAEKKLATDPNRIPPTKSAEKTLAKEFLRRKLPISRYVSYSLETALEGDTTMPGGFILAAGGDRLATGDFSPV